MVLPSRYVPSSRSCLSQPRWKFVPSSGGVKSSPPIKYHHHWESEQGDMCILISKPPKVMCTGVSGLRGLIPSFVSYLMHSVCMECCYLWCVLFRCFAFILSAKSLLSQSEISSYAYDVFHTLMTRITSLVTWVAAQVLVEGLNYISAPGLAKSACERKNMRSLRNNGKLSGGKDAGSSPASGIACTVRAPFFQTVLLQVLIRQAGIKTARQVVLSCVPANAKLGTSTAAKDKRH